MHIPYVLCFLTRGEQVLMLERRRPPNQGLWNGVGGHIEPGETPLQACLREVQEETGFAISAARYAGLLTWEGFEIPPGGLHIFTAEAPAEGQAGLCGEGALAWQSRTWVCSDPRVVSNIHVFGPHVLSGGDPRHWHFVYAGGKIERFTIGDPVKGEG